MKKARSDRKIEEEKRRTQRKKTKDANKNMRYERRYDEDNKNEIA